VTSDRRTLALRNGLSCAVDLLPSRSRRCLCSRCRGIASCRPLACRVPVWLAFRRVRAPARY
jgi:hypothetical protein